MKLKSLTTLLLALAIHLPSFGSSANIRDYFDYGTRGGNSAHTVRADKLNPSRYSLNVFGVYSRIVIRCTKGEVSFISQPSIVSSDNQLVPLRTSIRNMRAGDIIEIDLGGYRYDHRGRWYEYQAEVRTLELEIETPSLIGSRGTLDIQFIR